MPIKNALSLITFLGALLVAVGITTSPFLQSIGTALIFFGVLPVFFIKKPRLEVNFNVFSLLLILYFILHLAAGFYTADKAGYRKDICMKLPFLLIPLGLYFKNAMSKERMIYVLIAFIATVFIVGTMTFAYYLSHLDFYNERIFQSKPIDVISFKQIFMLIAGKPLPLDYGGNIIGLDHIYFSFMLAFAVWAAFYILKARFFINKTARWVIIVMVILMIIYLHTIAARTGLLAFYAAGLVVIFYIVFVMKKVAAGISLFLAVLGVGLLSILFIPSLHNRFLNTREDISSYGNQKIQKNYSISPRIGALKTAYVIFKESPLIGVSRGDLDAVMKQKYITQNAPVEEGNLILPHNQFIFELVASGLIGFFLLLAIFIYPLLLKRTRLNILFMLFIIICFFSFQAEYGLERQAGVSFFVLFYMLLSLGYIDLKEYNAKSK